MKSVEDTTSQTDSSNGSANEALAVDTTRRKRKKQDERNPFGPNGGVYFRPRNGKLVPHMFLPRILKSDVRRCYAQMFTNIYNSCDSSLMEKYLRTFYRPDFFFMQSFPGRTVCHGSTSSNNLWLSK